MQAETYDVLWLDRALRISLADLTTLSGVSAMEVHELVELGALAPINHNDLPWAFHADCVVTLRKASRLREDLELDAHAVALALTLMEQIRRLEGELAQLRARQSVMRF